MTKIEIIKSKRQWYWKIVAGNGEVLAHSETYKTKRGAYTGVKSFLKNFHTRISLFDGDYKYDGYISDVLLHLGNKK